MDLKRRWCGGYQETQRHLMCPGGHEVTIKCIDGEKVALKVF